VGAPPSLDVLHVVLCGHVVVSLRLVVEENSQHAGVDREGFDEGVLEGEVGVEIRQGFFELHGGRIWVQSQPGKDLLLHVTRELKVAN